MAKFRKKAVVIDAFQWTGDHDQREDPKWVLDSISEQEIYFSDNKMRIGTLEGIMTAEVGDYIIKGIMGEVYPCKPNIFIFLK